MGVLRYLVIGLGNIGTRRARLLGTRCAATNPLRKSVPLGTPTPVIDSPAKPTEARIVPPGRLT